MLIRWGLYYFLKRTFGIYFYRFVEQKSYKPTTNIKKTNLSDYLCLALGKNQTMHYTDHILWWWDNLLSRSHYLVLIFWYYVDRNESWKNSKNPSEGFYGSTKTFHCWEIWSRQMEHVKKFPHKQKSKIWDPFEIVLPWLLNHLWKF